MLKITLPNGVIVEGDVVAEITELVAATLNGPLPKTTNTVVHQPIAPVIVSAPEPESEPEPELEPEPIVNGQTFPHRYALPGRSAIYIGEREDECLKISKLICELAGDRCHRFRTREVYELSDNPISIHAVGSGFQGLKRKGLVRHAPDNRKRWIITERGWKSAFRVLPSAVPVGPTT